MEELVRECLIPLILFVCGALFCFTGEKMHKMLLQVMGFLCGFAPIAFVGWNQFRADYWIWLPAAIIVGALSCFFIGKVYSAAIFTLGALVGLTLCPAIFALVEPSESWHKVLIAVITALICGVLASNVTDMVIKVFTALLGASLCVYAVNLLIYNSGKISESELMLEGGSYTNYSFIAILALAASGFYYQRK